LRNSQKHSISKIENKKLLLGLNKLENSRVGFSFELQPNQSAAANIILICKWIVNNQGALDEFARTPWTAQILEIPGSQILEWLNNSSK